MKCNNQNLQRDSEYFILHRGPSTRKKTGKFNSQSEPEGHPVVEYNYIFYYYFPLWCHHDDDDVCKFWSIKNIYFKQFSNWHPDIHFITFALQYCLGANSRSRENGITIMIPNEVNFIWNMKKRSNNNHLGKPLPYKQKATGIVHFHSRMPNHSNSWRLHPQGQCCKEKKSVLSFYTETLYENGKNENGIYIHYFLVRGE